MLPRAEVRDDYSIKQKVDSDWDSPWPTGDDRDPPIMIDFKNVQLTCLFTLVLSFHKNWTLGKEPWRLDGH